MKRYSINPDYGNQPFMEEDPKGEYVKLTDLAPVITLLSRVSLTERDTTSSDTEKARYMAQAARQALSILTNGYALMKAEDVKEGDTVAFANGSRYVVEGVTEDSIGGVRHYFNDSTGSNCWKLGELCRVIPGSTT